jgi:hypothetical protein
VTANGDAMNRSNKAKRCGPLIARQGFAENGIRATISLSVQMSCARNQFIHRVPEYRILQA